MDDRYVFLLVGRREAEASTSTWEPGIDEPIGPPIVDAELPELIQEKTTDPMG